MIPTKEQLHGNWISECTQPAHLGDLGSIVKFNFDELPFDKYNIARVTVSLGKEENKLYTGQFEIKPNVNSEFFIVIGKDRIPSRQFSDNSFIVDLDKYGPMILIKSL